MSKEGTGYFYRFSQILGQDAAVDALCLEIENDRVHHAHLFSGPRGVGKELASFAWVSRLLCQQPEGRDACGRCAPCVKLKRGEHPDVLWVEPSGTTIKIEQVREISAATRFQPNEGRWRVVLISKAETMGEAAANALLKTLEEPSGNTLFALLTDRANQLLPTIRSRCVPVRFGTLPIEHVVDVLKKTGLEAGQADTLARLSRGAPGLALELAESPIFDERHRMIGAFVQLARGNLMTALLLAAEIGADNDREGFVDRLRVWNGIFRDVAVLLSTKRPELVHNKDELHGIEMLSSVLTLPRLFHWQQALDQAERRLYGNVNLRLIMESLVLECSETPA